MPSKPYAKSAVLTAHNAFVSTHNGFIWSQQHLSTAELLKLGVRGFMLDLHKSESSIVLRHGTSGIRGVDRPLSGIDLLFSDFLLEIKEFIEQTKGCHIVTLILESYITNQEVLLEIDKVNLTHYLLKRDPNDLKVTISSMCKQKENLVILSDTREKVPHVLTPEGFKENHFNLYQDRATEECLPREDRAPYNASDINIFVFNHFTSFSGAPFVSTATHYNSLKQVKYHLNFCYKRNDLQSFYPTFIALDYIDESSVPQCVHDKNCLASLEKPSHYNYDLGFTEVFDITMIAAASLAFCIGIVSSCRTQCKTALASVVVATLLYQFTGISKLSGDTFVHGGENDLDIVGDISDNQEDSGL